MEISINPDWCCSGIYLKGEGYLDPDKLEISDTLKKAFADWNKSLQDTFQTEGHTDKADRIRFNQTTRDLANKLQEELGDDHVVKCYTFYMTDP